MGKSRGTRFRGYRCALLAVASIAVLLGVCVGCGNNGGSDTLEEFDRAKWDYAHWLADAFCGGDDEEYNRALEGLENFNERRKEKYRLIVTWADVVEAIELRPSRLSGSAIPGFEYTEEQRERDRDCLIRARERTREIEEDAEARLLGAAQQLGHLLDCLGCPPDDGQIETALERATAGDLQAQYDVALLYQRRGNDPSDDHEALKWFRAAAERGHAPAQAALGMQYSEGNRATEKDPVASAWWTLFAAEQGDPGAQVMLALKYRIGEGAPRDLKAAYMWCSLAASSDGDAAPLRDLLRARLDENEIGEVEKRVKSWEPRSWQEIQSDARYREHLGDLLSSSSR